MPLKIPPKVLQLLKNAVPEAETEASRLARAKEMGFNLDKPLYHSTRANFNEFKPSHSGSLGPGVYASEYPEHAIRHTGYGVGQSIYPVYTNAKIFDFGNIEHINDLKKLKPNYKECSVDEIMDFVRDMGYGGANYGGTVNIFNPKNIRSKFAKFDPSKADSDDILAGLGGAATAAGVGYGIKKAITPENAIASEPEEKDYSKFPLMSEMLKKKSEDDE